MSPEDQPVERTFGDSPDEAGLFPSLPLVQNGEGSEPEMPPGAATQPDAMGGVDPFVLWAATSGKPLTSPPPPEPSSARLGKPGSHSGPRPAQPGRRKLISLLAVGTVGLVTLATVGGITFAREGEGHSSSGIADDTEGGSFSFRKHSEDGRGDDWGEGRRRQHKTPTPSQSPTPRPSPSPTQTPTRTPTMTTTGTVIGSTSQATNSAVAFTNPADGQGSFLIHLSNGSWVACERACTHQGVAVNYDAATKRLVCPAHGATFDPANGFAATLPAARPLPSVSIHVNANGTITTP